MRARLAAALVLVLAACSCLGPASSGQKLRDAAYDLANAVRFGRLDIALGYVEPEDQAAFATRRAGWGRELRVVDVELESLRLLDSDNAEVNLSVVWHRLDETTIRVSQIGQRWRQGRDDWLMVEEQRTGGAPGIFGRDTMPGTGGARGGRSGAARSAP
ncbi:MAG: hypothetical protein HY744_19970 [Deltaproteobacteria bacterium]|nr:hypothetical protein [Deltaproteobacteria bacterium]